MRKSLLPKTLLWASVASFLFTSCVNDSYLAEPPAVANQSFVEEFDTATAAYNRGWRFVNRSEPVGITDFSNFADVTILPFAAYSSKARKNGYLWADYLSTSAAAGIISSFAVSPITYMKNGDKIVFYTRAELSSNGSGDSTDYANRLQVRVNSTNTGVNCGLGGDPGDFNNTILDINPFLAPFLLSEFNSGVAQRKGAYPHRWTKFIANVSGLNKPTWGRFALRYYVEGAGSNGLASSIGIDSLAYIAK
ncbi:MAG: choice-of-anchor J domain-containing protein [Chitinophagaceae bacterium]|nr:choice-of-anchor J domain-containing protein [Chitinophagaceae bacterium]